MMMSKRYFEAAQFSENFTHLNELRTREETCDIHLHVFNQTISGHKLVLASASPFWRNMLYSPIHVQGVFDVEVKDCTYEVLNAVVNFMYTGIIDITSENVYSLYDASDTYQMELLKDTCLNFMYDNLAVDNCVKVWIIASKCGYDILKTAARNFIFSNLELVSNTTDFLGLSNIKILEFFNHPPKSGYSNEIVDSVLKWATDNDKTGEIIITILNAIHPKTISDEYLDNVLFKNQFIKSSLHCTIWMTNIFKEKSDIQKLKQANSDDEKKINKVVKDESIIFLENADNRNGFYKYNCHDSAIYHYNKKTGANYPATDCATYKHWIYVVGDKFCERFQSDDFENKGYDSSFHHDHGKLSNIVIINDSLYLVGGESKLEEGSCINLDTQQPKPFPLVRKRKDAGVTVCDGMIYIFGGCEENTVECYDPRCCRSTLLGSVRLDSNTENYFYSAATINNEIYFTNGDEYKMMDIRNNLYIDIDSLETGDYSGFLVSAYEQLYSIAGNTLHQYNNNGSEEWEDIASFPKLNNVIKAISFK